MDLSYLVLQHYSTVKQLPNLSPYLSFSPATLQLSVMRVSKGSKLVMIRTGDPGVKAQHGVTMIKTISLLSFAMLNTQEPRIGRQLQTGIRNSFSPTNQMEGQTKRLYFTQRGSGSKKDFYCILSCF